MTVRSRAYWKDIERDGRPAFWNDGKVVHACSGAEVVRNEFLMWTLCDRDVPAGKAYVTPSDDEDITCPKCRKAI